MTAILMHYNIDKYNVRINKAKTKVIKCICEVYIRL